MRGKQRPKVKPVRRYKAPKYPSHDQPDPTQHPYPVPYPLSRKFAAAVASMGITAALPQVAAAESPPEPTGPQVSKADEADAGNPFRVAISGLPHVTSPYGTGVPNYMDREMAREAIERVFKAAGYRLQGKHRYNQEGVAFVADGYDADKKVGYVFGDYENLDDDAYSSWTRALRPQQQPGGANPAPAEPVDTLRPEKLSLAEIRKVNERAPQTKEFIAVICQFDRRFAQPFGLSAENQKEYEAASKIPDPAKRNLVIKAIMERNARAAIEELEKCVREYIAWARTQGAQ